MNIPSEIATLINITAVVLSVCIIIGGFIGVRSGKQDKLSQFQKDTIEASQQRITVLEGNIKDLKEEITDLQKENTIQGHIIETITSALKQRGMVVTIDGDMVSIQDSSGISTHRKRFASTKPATKSSKEEVQH